MNIGWSTWEPGLVSPVPTSAGGASWTSYLFGELQRSGHKVFMLQKFAAEKYPVIDDLSKLDVAVFCWRWPMPEYPERQAAYERQMELLHQLGRAKVPILVHDQDHKVTDADYELIKEYGGVVAAPQFVLNGTHRADMTLFFPNPYPRGQVMLWGLRPVKFMYIGNNYERFDQVVRYVAPLSRHYKTEFYGNWLEPGPGRESPEYVKSMLPFVNFRGRLPQDHVIKTLMQADTTMHFAKQSYIEHGFITLRWAEAAAAGTVAFIPDGMCLPSMYYNYYRSHGLLPRDGDELIEAIKRIQRRQTWPEILALQWEFVERFMTVDGWLKALEYVVYKS